MPGPGSYKTDNKSPTKAVDFGKLSSRNATLQDNQLGPGSYEAQSFESKGVSIGVRRDISKDNQVPGPGHYVVEQKSKGGVDFSKA